jgi:hypothetical protein
VQLDTTASSLTNTHTLALCLTVCVCVCVCPSRSRTHAFALSISLFLSLKSQISLTCARVHPSLFSLSLFLCHTHSNACCSGSVSQCRDVPPLRAVRVIETRSVHCYSSTLRLGSTFFSKKRSNCDGRCGRGLSTAARTFSPGWMQCCPCGPSVIEKQSLLSSGSTLLKLMVGRDVLPTSALDMQAIATGGKGTL